MKAKIAAIARLRSQPEAAPLIAEELGVKDMGPADHIRTKHEIKLLIESTSTQKEVEAMVDRALTRRAQQEKQSAALKETERPGQNIRH